MPRSCAMLPWGFGPRAILHNFGHNFSVLTSAPVNICILYRQVAQLLQSSILSCDTTTSLIDIAVTRSFQPCKSLIGDSDWNCNVRLAASQLTESLSNNLIGDRPPLMARSDASLYWMWLPVTKAAVSIVMRLQIECCLRRSFSSI